ncbi:phage tail tape measure protein [Clostridium botulinum]|nr:phage tail tape measure protein [Clostridium botulinum]NFO40916.1 phage tail tape measure protein [Clostridium botulinum]
MSENLIVTLGLKDAGVNKQISAINKELRYLDKEFKTTNKSSKDFESSSEGLKNKLTYLEKKYEANNLKLQAYKQKMDEAKNAIAKKEEQLSKLTDAEEVNEKAVEKASNQLTRMKETLRDTERNISLTEAEMKNLSNETENVNVALKKNELEQYSKKLKNISENLNSLGDKLTNAGSKISTLGGNLMKLSSPLLAFSGYSAKVAMDFEEGMDTVQALSGATGKDLELLSDKAKEMGASTSKSAKESADALGFMSLAGWDVNQMLTGLEPILRMSEAANSDLALTSDLVTDSMSALGVEVEDLNRYLDIVAKSQSSANTSATQMLEAYISCGGTFKNLNVPLEESATWISILANRGKKASEAGNSLNSVLVNLTGGSSTAKGAMDELGVSAWDLDGNFIGIEATLRLLNDALATCTQEQKTNFESAIGGKTQLDTLQALLSGLNEEYIDLKGTITDSDGALNKLAETMQDNAKGNVTKLKSQLEGLGIQIGNYLLPHINDLLSHVSNLVTWFGSLDESTQKSIVKFGLMTFAGGGLLKGIGSLTSGIGGLVKSGSTMIEWASRFSTGMKGATIATEAVAGATSLAGGATGVGALASGLGSAVVAAAPFIAGAAAIGVAGYGIYKTMTKEVVPSIDLFGDIVENNKVQVQGYGEQVVTTTTKISDSTKQAVGAYMELDEGATFALNDLYINSTTLSEETANNLISTYGGMSEQITSGLEQYKNEDLNILNDFFENSKSMSEEEKNQIIQNTNESYAEQQKIIEDKTAEITKILEIAKEENRQITENEKNIINKLQQEMRDNAIKILSENELEAKAILERMSANDARITAEQASQHIKTLNESRDQAIVTANDEYDQRIKTIIRMRDEAGIISTEQANKLIQEATRQKEETIRNAEETREQAVEKMKAMNSELEETVNTTTGEIKTSWDKLKDWWNSWTPKVKSFFYKIKKLVSGGDDEEESDNSRSRVISIPSVSEAPTLARASFEMPATYDTMQLSGGYYTSDTAMARSIIGTNKESKSNTDTLLKEVKTLLKDNKNTQNNLTLNVNSVKQSPVEIFREAKKFQRDLALGF